MDETVEKLEGEKRTLEMDNAVKIEENRQLLDQLEELNNQVVDSDVQIQSLSASLQATQRELQRLTMLTQRASSLEAQLLALEAEHLQLHTEYDSSREGQRSAMQRWRRAEVTIGQLQAQIDRIEREAKEERDRHLEVIDRVERTRAVEKELENESVRPKAAMLNPDRDRGAGQVVSHFVRDILQDNANLQNGVMELRELLVGSNAEIENLREQLQIHRPMDEAEGAVLTTLNEEIKDGDTWADHASQASTDAASSLHVHHHYHAPSINVRKAKKKRPTLNPPHSSGTSTPRASRIQEWRANTPSSFATILSQTTASVPAISHQHRWSTQSTNTLSSFTSSDPSSPRQSASIFDTMESVRDSSGPTTPASSVPGSPTLEASEVTPRKPAARSTSGPMVLQVKSRASLGDLNVSKVGGSDGRLSTESKLVEPAMSPFGDATILEEHEPNEAEGKVPSYMTELTARPRLRRAASHESLLSVSGMDIHTLRERPSQLLLAGPFSPRTPQATASSSFYPPAGLTPETITARPAFTGRVSTGTQHARSILHSVQTGAERRPGLESRPSLTQKVGGWVWNKWTVSSASPEPSPSDRPVGVNQKGPITWLPPPKKTPIQVETQTVDSALLQESLGEVLLNGSAGV